MVNPKNVFIADVSEAFINKGAETYGYRSLLISEAGNIPCPDKYFDIVFRSSVIEHVTMPKEYQWNITSGRAFRRLAIVSQAKFASEIRRLGSGYFVQTPNKWFPNESDTWLPFAGYVPRKMLIPMLLLTNRFWFKQTSPDWNLLAKGTMSRLFPGAKIVVEKSMNSTKSIIAIKSAQYQ